MMPKKETHTVNHCFCFATFADKTTGTIYIDMTGKFPYQSLEGMQYVFVCYDYTTNAILAKPIQDTKNETIEKAFKCTFEYLEQKGFKPCLNIIDNQATSIIKKYLKTKEC